jgi:predicted AAA+ superfamily ATPase
MYNVILDEDMYLDRTIERFLTKVSGQFPVMLLTGPRQAGKTTVLKHASQKEGNRGTGYAITELDSNGFR